MGKKLRLGDVLKLTGSRKWAFFHRINTNREGDLLEQVSMKNKTDTTSVAQLAKLVATEQKKANYDHVVTLIRTIRRCYVDDERVMRVLVKEGLPHSVLTSVSELRKKATQGISCKAPILRLLLGNISDMFEWDFFGSGIYKDFLEEMLLILVSCNDCDDDLFSEAASVMMAMCATSISVVFDCLIKVKPQRSLLEKVLHDLPRAKSFFYEALVLELIYRLYRYTKKAGDQSSITLVAALINAFPVQIAHTLPRIPPKSFRDETRRLLNDFNVGVGVIKSLMRSRIDCTSSKSVISKIQLNPAGWIDVGGTMLEIEVKMLVDEHEVMSTIKLPYARITSVTPTSSRQVMLEINESACLGDIVDGLNDPRFSNLPDLRLCLSFEAEICAQAISILNHRMKASSSDEFITVESAPIGTHIASHTNKLTRESNKASAAPPGIDKISNRDTLCRDNAVSAQPEKGTLKRLRSQPDASVQFHPSKQNPETNIKAMPAKKKAKKPRSGEHEAETQHQESAHEPERNLLSERGEHGDKESSMSATERLRSTSEKLERYPHIHAAIIVPHEEELQDERPEPSRGLATERQTFRSRQAQHLNQLQSLVDDIVKTNDEFRDFNVARLCHGVLDESEALVKQKCIARDEANAFEKLMVVVHHNETKRSELLSRRKIVQDAITEVVGATALTEAEITARAEEILMEIQKSLDQEARHQLDRVQKKIRTRASQCVAQAKEKLAAIEKSFNTDDLHVMQQMLQRI